MTDLSTSASLFSLASDEEYRRMLDLMPLGIGIADARGNLLYFNAAMLQPGGWSPQDIAQIGNVAGLYYKSEDRNRILGEFAQKGLVDKTPVEFKKKDGSSYPTLMSLRKLIFQGNPAVLAIVEDVSVYNLMSAERDELVNELEKSQKAMINVLEDVNEEKEKIDTQRQQYQSLLNSIGDGVVATDLSGRITLVNPAFTDLFGFSKEELLGSKYVDLVVSIDEQGEKIGSKNRSLTVSMKEKTQIYAVHTYIKKDGSKLSVGVTNTPVVLDGKTIGGIVVVRDITKEKEIDKAKTEFISLASHQLRTPLSIVSWYCELLLSEDAGKLNSEQKEYANEAYQGSKRMVDLVNALLNVSRIELGTFMIDPIKMDVGDQFKEILTEYKPVIENKKLSVTYKKEKLPKIPMDPDLCRIIFTNLLSNAIKYTNSKGKIAISVKLHKAGDVVNNFKLERKGVVFSVSDTGMGIPKNQQKDIYKKLFRADNVRKADTEGTGLGLYMVESLIHHIQGKIWFTSKEGKGTTFYVFIPISGMPKKMGSKKLDQ